MAGWHDAFSAFLPVQRDALTATKGQIAAEHQSIPQ
jgi:hypothetical protein